MYYVLCTVYVQARSDFLPSNITNYWPGIHNTAFIVIFMDVFEWDCVDNTNVSVISILLLLL